MRAFCYTGSSIKKATYQGDDSDLFHLVLGAGFEPAKANADRFTVCCV